MIRTLLCTAAFVVAGQIAFAAITSDSVVTSLRAEGYTRIEVKQGPTQIGVEAIRGPEKLEIVYDIETGSILKQEIETVRPGVNTAPGVRIRNHDDDFVDGDDDNEDNNDDRGHESDGDKDGDDNRGSDNGDDSGDGDRDNKDNSGSDDDGDE